MTRHQKFLKPDWSKLGRLWRDPVIDFDQLLVRFDEFLDNACKDSLAWGDFIDWPHPDPEIESIRKRISLIETLFSSPYPTDFELAKEYVLEERNRVANRLELPIRNRWALGRPGS